MAPFPPKPPKLGREPVDKPQVDAHLVENAARARADATVDALTTQRMQALVDRMRARCDGNASHA